MDDDWGYPHDYGNPHMSQGNDAEARHCNFEVVDASLQDGAMHWIEKVPWNGGIMRVFEKGFI